MKDKNIVSRNFRHRNVQLCLYLMCSSFHDGQNLTQERDWHIKMSLSVNDWCVDSTVMVQIYIFLWPRKEIKTDWGNMGSSVGSKGRALQTPKIPKSVQDHLEASHFKEGRSQCEENYDLSFGNMDTQRIPRIRGIPGIYPEEANWTKYEPVQTWRLVEGQQIIARWQLKKLLELVKNLESKLCIRDACAVGTIFLQKGMFQRIWDGLSGSMLAEWMISSPLIEHKMNYNRRRGKTFVHTFLANLIIS